MHTRTTTFNGEFYVDSMTGLFYYDPEGTRPVTMETKDVPESLVSIIDSVYHDVNLNEVVIVEEYIEVGNEDSTNNIDSDVYHCVLDGKLRLFKTRLSCENAGGTWTK